MGNIQPIPVEWQFTFGKDQDKHQGDLIFIYAHADLGGDFGIVVERPTGRFRNMGLGDLTVNLHDWRERLYG